MVNATAAATPGAAPESPLRQDLEERIRLQDSIIGLLNDQLRECRERLDGLVHQLGEAYQRLQLASDLSAVREKDLGDEIARSRQDTARVLQQEQELAQELSRIRGELGGRDEQIEALRGALSEARLETEALRRTWSWRLTQPLRLIALGGASRRR